MLEYFGSELETCKRCVNISNGGEMVAYSKERRKGGGDYQ